MTTTITGPDQAMLRPLEWESRLLRAAPHHRVTQVAPSPRPHAQGTEHEGAEYLGLAWQRWGLHMRLPGHGHMQGRWCRLRGCRMLASGGCWDGCIGWWCLCLWLCRLRWLWELQCRRQGCRREAGRGQPVGELRGRRVQAGGVLHRGPRGRVVLLLVRLLSCELSGLGGRRHPSCKTGEAPQH